VKIKAKIVDRDRGFIALRKRMAAAKRSYAKVGVVGDAAGEQREGEVTNAMIAAVHEYGSPSQGIPQRSFIGGAFDKHLDENTETIKKLVGGIYDGKMDAERALGIIGLKAASDTKKFVTVGAEVPPPNAPSVLERKQAMGEGNPRTLIDTGRLITSITHDVVRR
jgi:hypothetical protein